MTAEIQKPAIRRRAAGFAERWGGTTSESAEKQTFWNEFFEIFGLDRKLTGQFERHAKRVSTGGVGAMDMLMPGEMAVEHKSADKDLDAAMEQLLDYLPSLSDAESPWLLVVCDFATFYIDNLRTGQSVRFPLGELAEHIEEFWWLAGHEKIGDEFESEEALNFTATLLMRDLHDNLSDTGYPDHARRVWLTRVLFCAFADDTAVWDRNLFMTYVDQSREDGSDLGGHLATLFQVLNTPDGDRSAGLDEHLAAFTYINGDIFAESIRLPYCNEDIRSALLEVCRFDWSSISPAIFGSLFQEVMTPLERREIGAHYTSEQNILRAIRPLFLDDMEAELKRADTLPKLEAFHERLATATFMDPACGCGNFLVVSYRELRRLELETIRAMQGKRASRRSGTIRTLGERAASLDLILRITLDQFRGIEIEEFPARIASTALYLADHIANREASREFGDYYQRFPIERSPHIHIGNALDMDWDDLGEGQEIDYVFGNPPFVGFVLRTQSQKDDLVRVLGDQASRRVDYVFGWYAKAMDYAADNTRCAFVSTNSVTQGEQAAVLTRLFQDHAANVRFAHRTFAWKSEARGRANVHVVIIGFDQIPTGRRVLVEYPEIDAEGEQRDVKQINSYLVEAPNILIMRRRKPLGDVPELRIGSKPNDAGNLLLSPDERHSLPQWIQDRYTRKAYGGRELLNDLERWCLWLADASPKELRELRKTKAIRDRLEGVRKHRSASTNKQTQATAATPALFWNNKQPKSRFLAAPETGSEARRIAPMTYLEPTTIITNTVYSIEEAPLWLFGILQSAMFDSWMRAVGGRFKNDPRVSPGAVYNTFPFPKLTQPRIDEIELTASQVVDVRSSFPDSSLADLYHRLSMPSSLVKAHDALDRAV